MCVCDNVSLRGTGCACGGRAGARCDAAKTGSYASSASAKLSGVSQVSGGPAALLPLREKRDMVDNKDANCGAHEVELPDDVQELLRQLDEADASVARLGT